MKQEEWIEKILNTTENLQPVEPNPNLFERLTQQINISQELLVVRSNDILKWSIAASVLIVMNVFVCAQKLHKHPVSTHSSQAIENTFSNGTSYIY